MLRLRPNLVLILSGVLLWGVVLWFVWLIRWLIF
jgi:hypothetical protein